MENQETILAEKKPARRAKPQVDSEVETTDALSLGVFKLSETAVVPTFGTQLAACFDLSADLQPDTIVNARTASKATQRRTTIEGRLAVHPGDRVLVPTGLILDIPEGYCLEVYARSGASFKLGLSLSNCVGMIDADYTDELFVSVVNIGTDSFYISPGERIAQAKLVKLVNTEIKVLETRPSKKADRQGGFGSTGNK